MPPPCVQTWRLWGWGRRGEGARSSGHFATWAAGGRSSPAWAGGARFPRPALLWKQKKQLLLVALSMTLLHWCCKKSEMSLQKCSFYLTSDNVLFLYCFIKISKYNFPFLLSYVFNVVVVNVLKPGCKLNFLTWDNKDWLTNGPFFFHRTVPYHESEIRAWGF